MNNKLAIKISLEIEQIDYLTFRHFYRHSYTYFLNWVKLEQLVISLEAVWSQAKAELNELFLDRLSSI